MSFLLDTHVWIWSEEAPEMIGPGCRALLEDLENSLFVSTVSSLEISRLRAAGTVSLTGSLTSWIEDTLDALSCMTIPISHEIAATAYELPGSFHKDPADRVLLATALIHDLELMTADTPILDYRHVRTRNARS